MKLTTFTDYSLRVLIYLAAQPGRRATIEQIAQAFDVKENHLTKVVHALGKAGWLCNVRGRGGGLDLARRPEDIVVGHVVRQAEGTAAPAECFGAHESACCIAPQCRLRGVLHEAAQAFDAVLDNYTLADLVQDRAPLARILFAPRAATPLEKAR